MGGNRQWRIFRLSSLLFALTELSAPATSHYLRRADVDSETGTISQYQAGWDYEDIGGTLRLLGYLMSERDGLFPPSQAPPSAQNLKAKDGPRTETRSRDPLAAMPVWSELQQQSSRRDVIAELLHKLEQRSLLESLMGPEAQADDKHDRPVDDEDEETDEEGDLRLLGPSSGHERRVSEDLRVDSLSTVPPTSLNEVEE
ncbi:hypothetical protein PoB_005837900 [Plakobranchus ocellatus]|uniref:Uncharacterized protein n=1 Tax=Plakobranchus ocellatus TaxID=259542 RepID=A0AAV4CLH2_9GAST|nr:hypothetical protein PoB_005837900 [Plakobranchus ocellatus]